MTPISPPPVCDQCREIALYFLGRRRGTGKVRVRTRMCTSLFTYRVKIKTLIEVLSIRIRGLGRRRRDPSLKGMMIEHPTKSDERFKTLESIVLNLVTFMF